MLNILFVRRKFFTDKTQEGDDLLDHVNKVKALADQLTCLEVSVKNKDVVMTLLESLLPSYEHSITALETMPIKELITYVTTSLMHKMSKRKQSESSCDYVAIVLCKGKAGKPSWRKDVKMCYYCGKLGYITRFSYKTNNNNQENANNIKEDDDYTFVMQHQTHSEIIWKWIMYSGAKKHMTYGRTAFDTYKVIAPFNVCLGDDSIMETIGMGPIII